MQIRNSVNKLNNPNFLQHGFTYCHDSIGYRIKSVFFDSPTRLDKAVSEISSDEFVVEMLSCYKHFLQRILNRIEKDLAVNKQLQNIKVKGMIDYGQTAFVFEAENGDIIKITNRNHFLSRKAEPFDMPVKSHGKLAPGSFCHYYIEDKVSELQDVNEMNSFIKEIENQGFKVVDCGIRQFGKTTDGKIVLIDPECARKKGILGLIKQKFAKIKSYISIVAKEKFVRKCI